MIIIFFFIKNFYIDILKFSFILEKAQNPKMAVLMFKSFFLVQHAICDCSFQPCVKVDVLVSAIANNSTLTIQPRDSDNQATDTWKYTKHKGHLPPVTKKRLICDSFKVFVLKCLLRLNTLKVIQVCASLVKENYMRMHLLVINFRIWTIKGTTFETNCHLDLNWG